MAATNVLHATRFAKERGRPLTLSITFGWHLVGLNADQGKAVFKQLRQKIRRQWVYRSEVKNLGSFDDVRSHEAPGGIANTHWVIYVPPKMQVSFETSVERFLQKLIPHVNIAQTDLLHFAPADAPGQLMKYILKGIDQKFANYLHIDHVDQGFIPGRGRTAVSPSIGFKARSRQAGNESANGLPCIQPNRAAGKTLVATMTPIHDHNLRWQEMAKNAIITETM